MNYLLKKNVLATFTMLAMVFTANTANAAAVSMTRETTVTVDGKEVLQSSIRCSQSTTPRVMQREKGSKRWCSAEITDYCFSASSKIKAAKSLCSSSYTKALRKYQNGQTANTVAETPKPAQAKPEPAQAKPEPAKAKPEPAKKVSKPVKTKTTPNAENTNRGTLIKEQMRIEEERILIEQQQLELRAKELELKKKQLESQ